MPHLGDHLSDPGGSASTAGRPLADFQSFVEQFDRALTATRDDPAKFGRFAAAVLSERDMSPANRALLKAELSRLVDWEASAARLNGA